MDAVILLVVIGLIAFGYVYSSSTKKNEKKLENEAIQKRRHEIKDLRQEQEIAIRKIAEDNRKLLAITRSRFMALSGGANRNALWMNAIYEFVAKHSSFIPMRKLYDMNPDILVPASRLFDIVDEVADESQREFDYLDSYSNEFSGGDYELFCINVLIANGWDAAVTPKTGDQGLDIIAHKDGQSVGVQCKHYKTSIGNKAVQEALSGKLYYDIQSVTVVTNSTYTRSACALADKTGVVLLHHTDLCMLDDILQNK